MSTFTTTKTIEVELEFEVEFSVHPGQRQIIHPADNAQEGIPAHVEEVSKFTLDRESLKELLEKMEKNPEYYVDFDELLEDADDLCAPDPDY